MSGTKFTTPGEIDELIGKPETDEIEFKASLLSIKTVMKLITSFINGKKENGYVILGVSEDQHSKLASEVKVITFPATVRGEGPGDPNWQATNLGLYKKRILDGASKQIVSSYLDAKDAEHVKELLGLEN